MLTPMDTAATQHVPSHLPAEFAGRARLFRTRMSNAAEISGHVLHHITEDLFNEWQRRKKAVQRKVGLPKASLREDTVRDIENRWRAIPSFGGLGQTVFRDGRFITATDTRIRPEKLRSSDWLDPGTELALTVVTTTLVVNKQMAQTTSRTIVSMSLRVIGRFYQCAFAATDEALLQEIGVLAQHAPAMLDTPGQFSIPSEHGEAWLGLVAPFHDVHGNQDPCLNVREFR
jgi:hypothetical protein